jgi:hypothetical protein
MKGSEQLQVKRLQNILAPNGALAYCCKEGSVDPKIKSVINETIYLTPGACTEKRFMKVIVEVP